MSESPKEKEDRIKAFGIMISLSKTDTLCMHCREILFRLSASLLRRDERALETLAACSEVSELILKGEIAQLFEEVSCKKN